MAAKNLDKKKVQVVAVLLLSLVLLYLLKGALFPGNPTSSVQSYSSGSSAESPNIFESFDENVGLIAGKEIDDGLETFVDAKNKEDWGRNPFKVMVETRVETDDASGAPTEVEKPEFDIQGIIYLKDSPEDSSIMVNGELMKKGTDVNGWTIEAIEPQTVTLRKGEVEYIHTLYQDDDRQLIQ